MEERQTQNNSTIQQYHSSSSSHIQSYDPQSYYASYYQHYAQQTLDYSQSTSTHPSSSSYYYPDYSNSYDPNSIQPPGVPLSVDSQQTQVPNSQIFYHPSQSHGYFQPGQPVSQGGRPTRGRGRVTFGRHGSGRGGGRGKHVIPQTSAPSKQPPQKSWCELCRVECNTLEILEKHKSGKKHLRNVKVFEELQTTNKPITVVYQQVSLTQSNAEGSDQILFPTEHVPEPEAVQVPMMAQQSRGRGSLKRKMNGGRDGPWGRAPKPKQQMVPILCELCNVKCESQIVYQSHIAGKKHLSTIKRYQGHKQAFGEGVEALYPTIPILPAIPINPPQTHQQIPVAQDAHGLASMILGQQNLPDPEGTKAAVAQLLNQHGIHDAQTLIAQLVPYLLTQQSQVPGSIPLPTAGLENISSEVEGQNGVTKTIQENLASYVGHDGGAETSQKPDDRPPEAGKVEAE